MDGLRRFNENLGHGLLGRRIECSPLPFGRHRWVMCHEPPDIDVAAWPRPRTDIGTWLDERAQIPIDPEHGPCWHIGVLRLEEGGTAVTVVFSHTVVDGVGFCVAVNEAVNGRTRDFGYPPPRSRNRLRALLVDGLDTLRGLPAVFRALIAIIVIVVRRGRDTAGLSESPPFAAPQPDDDEPIVLPAVTVFCDLAEWDARAVDLGGNSSSLFIGFAARLAELLGRVNATDGGVTITVPVSERAPDDTRGNALTSVTFRVDPTRATDLPVIRNEMAQSLAALQQAPNELLKSLPLTPLTPKWLARKMEGLALGNSDLPVCCSNMRDMYPAMANIDGADADYCSGALFNQGATRRNIEDGNGQLYICSGRINGRLFIRSIAYQPGIENSKKYLRAMLEQALADYELTAEIEE
ncbi:hypothetical protein MHAE_10491 [Mycobacterium haemophilum DSM 44634]|nr:hypothetical protein [Mycobacterium haemophilum]